MRKRFRFAFCIDREGWCFERTADSLKKFSRADSTWDKICAIDPQGQMLKEFDPTYDLYRFGGVPLLKWFVEHDIITKPRHNRRCIPTFASFREATYTEFSIFLHENIDLLAGVVVNDRRMFPHVMQYGVPVIYSPDCVDYMVFKPKHALQPPPELPLRVGWAGSIKAWGGIKHQAEIQQACDELDGVEFVRQDRELDGPKNQAEMCDWFNGLHVYISANDIDTCTPVPQIESIACGTLPVTTKCGERWDLIAGVDKRLILQDTSISEIKRALSYCRDSISEVSNWGMTLRRRHFENVISWQCGEATLSTEAMEALAWTVPMRKGKS
jgi:hypothetical protein